MFKCQAWWPKNGGRRETDRERERLEALLAREEQKRVIVAMGERKQGLGSMEESGVLAAAGWCCAPCSLSLLVWRLAPMPLQLEPQGRLGDARAVCYRPLLHQHSLSLFFTRRMIVLGCFAISMLMPGPP